MAKSSQSNQNSQFSMSMQKGPQRTSKAREGNAGRCRAVWKPKGWMIEVLAWDPTPKRTQFFSQRFMPKFLCIFLLDFCNEKECQKDINFFPALHAEFFVHFCQIFVGKKNVQNGLFGLFLQAKTFSARRFVPVQKSVP